MKDQETTNKEDLELVKKSLNDLIGKYEPFIYNVGWKMYQAEGLRTNIQYSFRLARPLKPA